MKEVYHQITLEEQIMTLTDSNLKKIVAKLDKQLETAQSKVSEIQAHIAALKRHT